MKATIYGILSWSLTFAGVAISRVASRQDLVNIIELLRPERSPLQWRQRGPLTDGGYRVPENIGKIDGLFSPGVGQESGFELSFAMEGVRCFLADGTVAGPRTNHQNFTFIQKNVGAFTGGKLISIDDWVSNSGMGKSANLALQMDIEGAEYASILSVSSRVLEQFKFVLIEIHHLDKYLSKAHLHLLDSVLSKLKCNHFLIDVKPNNYRKPLWLRGLRFPVALELTFVRKDIAADWPGPEMENLSGTTGWPPNVPHKKVAKIAKEWLEIWISRGN